MIDNFILYLETIDWVSTKDLIVTLCALVGAVLGIYNSIQLRKSKEIKLEIIADYGPSHRRYSGSGEDQPYDSVFIEVQNVHHRPAGIDDIYLRVPFRKLAFSLVNSLEEIDVDSVFKTKEFKISSREIKGNERRHFETSLTSFFECLNTLKLKEKTKFTKIWLRLIKIGVKTNVGKKSEKRPQKFLLKKMLEMI